MSSFVFCDPYRLIAPYPTTSTSLSSGGRECVVVVVVVGRIGSGCYKPGLPDELPGIELLSTKRAGLLVWSVPHRRYIPSVLDE